MSDYGYLILTHRIGGMCLLQHVKDFDSICWIKGTFWILPSVILNYGIRSYEVLRPQSEKQNLLSDVSQMIDYTHSQLDVDMDYDRRNMIYVEGDLA